jgi:hypothetical protein
MAAMSRCLLDTSVVIAQTDEGLDGELPEETAISVAILAELPGVPQRSADR